MKVIYRPFWGNWIILLFLVAGACCGLFFGIYGLVFAAESFSSSVCFSVFLFLSACLILSVSFFLTLAILWFWAGKCRQSLVDETGARRGLILPETIRWKDVTGCGAAPLWVNIQKDGTRTSSALYIYVLTGEHSRDEISANGIHQIWTWKCVEKHLPALAPFLTRLERHGGRPDSSACKTGDELTLPDKIIWLPYSKELYQYILSKVAAKPGA